MSIMPFNLWILSFTLPLLNGEVVNQRMDMLHKKTNHYFRSDTLQWCLTIQM